MPALLLLEPLPQRFHQLVPAAERFDKLFLFLGEDLLGKLLEPLLRNHDGDSFDLDDALEVGGEHAVVAIVVFLVLHQAGAGEIVELLHAAERDALRHRLDERQELLDRDRDAALLQLEKELDQHRKS